MRLQMSGKYLQLSVEIVSIADVSCGLVRRILFSWVNTSTSYPDTPHTQHTTTPPPHTHLHSEDVGKEDKCSPREGRVYGEGESEGGPCLRLRCLPFKI
jgi:hypothetical protein